MAEREQALNYSNKGWDALRTALLLHHTQATQDVQMKYNYPYWHDKKVVGVLLFKRYAQPSDPLHSTLKEIKGLSKAVNGCSWKEVLMSDRRSVN